MKSKTKSTIFDGVYLISDGTWIYVQSKLFSESKSEKSKIYDEIMGKYLFFHQDQKTLLELAVSEIKKGGFHVAKVSKKIMGGNNDYVLCLYYKDDSRKNELAKKYQEKNGIRYRYWKSDEDTRKGKYSKEFLDRVNK